ncbi:hypothetical protein Naga_100035g44 [Nannochloropsis gaditana]|uniref:Uncharacterized protein n=1 Tax=Nannochloropsis gaditana TaxID=72520 RepID=W7UAZ5_9STRA|nr:hypothetical protein Naga_100035g44 [Nannochloropsis gaditana]
MNGWLFVRDEGTSQEDDLDLGPLPRIEGHAVIFERPTHETFNHKVIYVQTSPCPSRQRFECPKPEFWVNDQDALSLTLTFHAWGLKAEIGTRDLVMCAGHKRPGQCWPMAGTHQDKNSKHVPDCQMEIGSGIFAHICVKSSSTCVLSQRYLRKSKPQGVQSACPLNAARVRAVLGLWLLSK